MAQARQADNRETHLAQDLKTLGLDTSLSFAPLEGGSAGGKVAAATVNTYLTNAVGANLTNLSLSGLSNISLSGLTAALWAAGPIIALSEIADRIGKYEERKTQYYELGPGKPGYETSIPKQIKTDYDRLRSHLEEYIANSPSLKLITDAIGTTHYQIWDLEAINVPIPHTTGSAPTKNIIYARDVSVDTSYPRPGYIATGNYGYLVASSSADPTKHWSHIKPPDIINPSRRINIRDRWNIPANPLPEIFTEPEYQTIATIIRDLYFYNTPLQHYNAGISWLVEAEQGRNALGIPHTIANESINIMDYQALPELKAVIPEFIRFQQIVQIIKDAYNRVRPADIRNEIIRKSVIQTRNEFNMADRIASRQKYRIGIPPIDWLITHF